MATVRSILGVSGSNAKLAIKKGAAPVSVVGVGHVGLPLALLLIEQGARVFGCDNNEEYLKQLKSGRSTIVEHSQNLFSSARVLQPTCPTCGVRILKVGRETFCPSCMRRVVLEAGAVRLTSEPHEAKTREGASKEVETLLRRALRSGRLTLTSDTTEAVRRSSIVVVTVGTPIDEKKQPDPRALVAAARSVGQGLKEGDVVIVRSTVSPGTTEDVIGKILAEESGLAPGRDFGLAHVPETTIEGLALFELRTLSKLVGGVDPSSSKAAAALFSVFDTPTYIFDKPRTTETAKLFLNIYRDVNIALANELAQACEALGVDVIKVIEATHADPKTNFLTPGPGVGGYCLPPWVRVQTDGGLKEICNVSVGDQVLSHDGHYHRVLKVLTRDYTGPILRIHGRGFRGFPIGCTPEHPILARKRITNGKLFYSSHGRPKMSNKDGEGRQEFIMADNLEQGDVLYLPTPRQLESRVPSIPYSFDYHREGIWQEIAATREVMYLFGLFLAEGSTWENRIDFYLNRKETFIVEELDRIGRGIFGNGAKLHKTAGNGISGRIYSKPLADYLRATFGHECSQKRVPMSWLTSLPREHLKSLLEGIWIGDGSNCDNRFTFGTTSEELWNFVQLALLRLGVRFAVNQLPRHRGRDGVWHRKAYYIRSSDVNGMNEVVHQTQRLVRTRKEYRTMWYDNGFLAFPIRRIERSPYAGPVWNLEVEGANSYVLQGGTVHNCLPKDSYYLTSPATRQGFSPRLLLAARNVNDSMPAHVVSLTRAALEEAGLHLQGAVIAVLGVAFKGNTADTRESPSISVIRELLEAGARPVVHDPLVLPDDARVLKLAVERRNTIPETVTSAQAVLILTDHLEYRGLTGAGLKRFDRDLAAVVDARHILDPSEVRSAGLVYRGVGRGYLKQEPKK